MSSKFTVLRGISRISQRRTPTAKAGVLTHYFGQFSHILHENEKKCGMCRQKYYHRNPETNIKTMFIWKLDRNKNFLFRRAAQERDFSSAVITARIRRMTEGNVFTLSTIAGRGGTYPSQVRGGGYLPSQAGGYLASQAGGGYLAS